MTPEELPARSKFMWEKNPPTMKLKLVRLPTVRPENRRGPLDWQR